MTQKKYGIAILVVLAAIILIYSQQTRIRSLKSELVRLESQNAKQRSDSNTMDDILAGFKNMMTQYDHEMMMVLKETAPSLPVVHAQSQNEEKMIGKIKVWIREHRMKQEDGIDVLDHNRVILSLRSLGEATDHSHIIEAVYYEIPTESKDSSSPYPRPIGKDYIGIAQFILNQNQGDWIVKEFKDTF